MTRMVVERPKPIIDQVNAIIRQRIRNRTYPPGGRMPSEHDLAAELRVSRATIRSVLALLAAERLIIRRQGDGTYINQQIREVNTNLGGLWDFTNIIESSGYKATIQGLSTCCRPAAETEITRLNLPPTGEVVELVRLFLADGQPVVLCTNIIPAAILSQPANCDFETALPLHRFLKRYCNEEIVYVISDISAVVAGARVAETLGCQAGTPLLQFTEVFYNADNQPLTLGSNFYDDKRLRLRLIQPWG